jgi:spore germination protein AB
MQPQSIPESRKISPYLVFYTVVSMQIGVGALGFQRIIAQIAGYDSWQSVIFAGLATNVIMWFMYKQLETVNGDITDIHRFVFGKWIGSIFNILFIFYFSMLVLTILRTYIEVIQVWMFPDLHTFWFALLYLLLSIYIVNGGIRTVVGIAFFAYVLPFYIIFVFGFAVPYSDFRHFLPLFSHSINDVLSASQSMSLTYIGYETIFVFYPFIKDPKKSKKWAHSGLLFSTILYLYITIITFAFYAQRQLQKDVWATLTTFKIVHFPVVERFEYIGIANWCLIILPNVSLSLWCASRILKKTLKIKQKKGVVILSALILFGCLMLKTRLHIDLLNNFVGNIGFLINFVYVPILFLLLKIVKKVKKKS